MKRSEGSCGALKSAAARSDVIAYRPEADKRRQATKRANRRSVEFPQRKVYDASCQVKKSNSFDHPPTARKARLAYVAGDKSCAVVFESPPRSTRVLLGDGAPNTLLCPAKTGLKLVGSLFGDWDKGTKPDRREDGQEEIVECASGVIENGATAGLVSGLRRDRSDRSNRCRSSPLPPSRGSDRGPPVRLCRTWYGGYDALLEDEPTFIKQKSTPAATVATCGARRRAEGRKRREGVGLGGGGVSGSLLLLPRLSAAVIPLRRNEGRLSRSAAPLLPRDPSLLSLSLSSDKPRTNLLNKELARSAAPLLQRDDSGSLVAAVHHSPTLRKCETVLALTGLESSEPRRPVNRLRPSSGNPAERVCSRCSSLLSLAASGSRYSLSTVGGFVPVDVAEEPSVLCKLCLEDAPGAEATTISHCGCVFCTKCMKSYAEYEIMNGAYDISCPDSKCLKQGVMLTSEVERLVTDDLVEKHRKFRLNHEVAMDGCRAFCPRAGCETICVVSGGAGSSNGAGPPGGAGPPQVVFCPTCSHHFCSACANKWHAGMDCAAYIRQMALEAGSGSGDGLIGLTGDSDLIKWCPMCRVPIEKDEGCAQMMCKRCKHVFCWYCLASLDDDFLLRHYDKGPCKNKLGHSRASVIWHRAQVVGIFAGFGLLLLVASPLLLLAAPCIVCCKCRLCNTNGGKALDGDEAEGMDLEVEFGNDDTQRVTASITE